jgi:hypothetical protein
MNLVNFPEIRIKHYPKGYAVEIASRTWYGRKKWKNIHCFSGIKDKPFYFSSRRIAIEQTLDDFRFLLRDSYFRK